MPPVKRKRAPTPPSPPKEEVEDAVQEKAFASPVESVNEEEIVDLVKKEDLMEPVKSASHDGGPTLKEAEKADEEGQKLVEKEEAKLVKEAEKKIKGMTETELERQLEFLLNQSEAFMGFMHTKLGENAVKTKKTPVVAPMDEEDKENSPVKSNSRGRRRSSGSRAGKKATLAEKEAAAGAAKAAALAAADEELDHHHIPVLFQNGKLRDYQVEGYQWMKTLYLTGINGILADEMGLGKTVQAIAMIAHLYETGFSTRGPTLVVAPLSTLPNWDSEFKRFTPEIPVVLYHGSKDGRKELRSKLSCQYKLRGELHYPVIITSYQIVCMDVRFLEPYKFTYFVMDEGHRIKNFKCQLLRNLKRLNISEGRLLLTGTPLQNDLTELWSLLNFILPVLFDDLQWFTAYFDFTGGHSAVVEAQRKKAMVTKLHSILKPILLRRMKADVELDLPPKREIIVYAPLAEEQESIYRKIIENALKAGLPNLNSVVSETRILSGKRKRAKVEYSALLEEDDDAYLDSIQDKAVEFDDINFFYGDWGSSAPKARVWEDGGIWRNPELDTQSRNAMMLLRQVCLHPFIVQLPTDESGPYIPQDERIVTESGKMMIMDQLLKSLKAKGHKALIFSQFTRMLEVLEVYCKHREFDYVRLDGSTALEDRATAIARFNGNEDTFLFLISTRAGNLGMNLCAADTVILYDSDWNPQSDLQAQDRCHRIGQTRPVVIYRITARGTVDEKIVNVAIDKRRVERTVIGGGKFNKLRRGADDEEGVSPEELARMLEETDHSATIDATTGALLSDVHLASLLDRNFTDAKTPAKSKAFKVIATDKEPVTR